MAVEIPMFPKASSLVLHTGNIVNWNRLKRKLSQTPTEELSECITSTVGTWLAGSDKDKLQYEEDLVCLNEKFIQKLNTEERDQLKLTVKIFLYRLDTESILTAVDMAMEELGVKTIESVLLSCNRPAGQTPLSVEELKPLWQCLEGLVDEGKVFSLGISDLDKDRLEELYSVVKVKPCINQVNLSTCCVIPPEMTQFAKEHDILLMTHSDPLDILPVSTLEKAISSNATEKDGSGWASEFVVRYSVVVTSRGVIKSKGYILRAARDHKKQQ